MKIRHIAIAFSSFLMASCASQTYQTELMERYGRAVPNNINIGAEPDIIQPLNHEVTPSQLMSNKSWASWNDVRAENAAKQANRPYGRIDPLRPVRGSSYFDKEPHESDSPGTDISVPSAD